MPEAPRCHHISSIVVSVLPPMADSVLARLAAMPAVEVHGHQGGKIVIVVEGSGTGAMGDHLTRIALLDGVVAANMVYEHIETEEATEQ
ncbi:chaperone NapD [Allomesorhizobium alhagi]|uniref:Chaperone NapD n=1 Tax=Mesorhizobium alhagi CCNWXJ12-2 TaxID=1107882 RepID=H0I1E3_9HYPH|nr:chaperone NapD [Mesorhizobium alhagi]EHK53209.1 NapD family protein [Mesorhizobium alhagi CCNWXJ12-2]